MTKLGKKSPKKAQPSGRSGEKEYTATAAEKREHQEHLKRLKKHKKKRRQQIIGLVIECLLLVLVIGGYIFVSYLHNITQRINARTTDPAKTTTAEPTMPNFDPSIPSYTEPGQTDDSNPGDTTEQESPDETRPPIDIADRNGFYTFVVFGVDARDQSIMGKGTHSDVCVLITINKESGDINILSVYRDFAVETSEDKYRKLTDCYSLNGPEVTMDVLSRNLDLPISDFVVVNWTAIADLVDIMGGLEVELTLEEAKECNKYIWDVQDYTGRPDGTRWVEEREGVQNLNGIGVVAFCRLRYNGMGDDFGRTERQRYVIGLMVEKAKTQSLPKIVEMVDTLADNLKTTLEPDTLLALAMDYRKYNLAGKGAMPRSQVSDKSVHYYMYANDLVQEVSEIHSLLYGEVDYTPLPHINRLAEYHQNVIREGKNSN